MKCAFAYGSLSVFRIVLMLGRARTTARSRHDSVEFLSASLSRLDEACLGRTYGFPRGSGEDGPGTEFQSRKENDDPPPV